MSTCVIASFVAKFASFIWKYPKGYLAGNPRDLPAAIWFRQVFIMASPWNKFKTFSNFYKISFW